MARPALSARPVYVAPIVEDDQDAEFGWRILVVCTANVSRSPFAAEALRRHLRAFGLPAVVRSAGTRATELAVDADMVAAGWELGIDVSEHRPRRLTPQLIAAEGRDLVVTMTRDHLREVIAHVDQAWPRTFTLREIVRRAEEHRLALRAAPEQWLDVLAGGRDMRAMLHDDPADEVEDPYRRSLDTHRRVAADIDDLCRRLVAGVFDVITE